MTGELIPSTAWLKAERACGWGEHNAAAITTANWQETSESEVIRVTPRAILVFGAPGRLAVPLQKGGWFRVTYRIGAKESGQSLEITHFEKWRMLDGGRMTITCLVHERWLQEFNASLESANLAGALRPGSFHLPSELRSIAAQALRHELTGTARTAYRTAKGLELLCDTAQMWLRGGLIPRDVNSGLSAVDVQRLFDAKRTISEQFEKKLTLKSIGRACGLNRTKLARGFKTVFGISIANALSEERLRRASLLLMTTNKPVSMIGHEAGYLNNASFARAFTRRFGTCPSSFRSRELSTGMPTDTAKL